MALPKPILTAYVLLIAVLVYRALYYPAELAGPPPKQRCTFDWKRARCSAGCTLKLPGGCKRTDAAAPPPAPAVDVSQADSLMRKLTVANCLAAADIYEAAAGPEATTGSARQLQLKAADAINCAMRIETNGNIMVLEGTVDTPAAKKFWGLHGQRALNLVRSAKKDAALASDASLAAAEMDAFMYASSAKGIIQQALTGAGSEFVKLANVLVSKHPTWDNGIGRNFLAGFYNIAPWPLGDKKRALAEVMKTQTRHPHSRRNNYYACLLHLQQGETAAAIGHCEAALRAKCVGTTEPDYCGFLTSEIHRLLKVARAQIG